MKDYRTPTDDDAKQRPRVQCRDCKGDRWRGGYTLIAVSHELGCPFVTIADKFKDCDGRPYGPIIICFDHCRIASTTPGG